MLITLNHRDVWDYDWHFYKTSLEAIAELKKEMMKDISLAICNGVNLAFSEEREKKKFLEGN